MDTLRLEFPVSQGKRRAPGVFDSPQTDQYGGLFVSQMFPPMAELARMGVLYGANTGAGTAITPVAAMPTTAATWCLYNPVSSTKKLVVTAAYCYAVSGTVGLGLSLLLGNAPSVVASAPTAYASSVTNGLNPGQPTTVAIFGQAVTLVAPVWNVEATREQLAAVSVGAGLRTPAGMMGKYIIRPGYGLGGVVLGADGSSDLFGFGFEWAELPLDI